MDCLVINLSTATDRMQFMATQLDKLGLRYTRIEAITAKQAISMRDAAYWVTWERPLKDTEKACLLSHVQAWEHVQRSGHPALILEDDALLSKHVPEVLQAVEKRDFNHLSLETRNRKKLLAHGVADRIGKINLFRMYQDRSGAAAYVLWPSGAQMLLKRAQKQAALADAMICAAYELHSYQVEPAGAVQLELAEHFKIHAPVSHHSLINAGRPYKPKGGIRFRLRRMFNQIRLGLRSLRYFSLAKRRYIDFDPRDFSE